MQTEGRRLAPSVISLVGWLVGRLVGWLVGWLVGRSVGPCFGDCQLLYFQDYRIFVSKKNW
jgi:hypothetical protein